MAVYEVCATKASDFGSIHVIEEAVNSYYEYKKWLKKYKELGYVPVLNSICENCKRFRDDCCAGTYNQVYTGCVDRVRIQKRKELIWKPDFSPDRYFYKVYYLVDGLIKDETITKIDYRKTPVGINEKMVQRVVDLGYKPVKWNEAHVERLIIEALWSCDGKTMGDFDDYVRERIEKYLKRNKKREKDFAEWNKLREKFDGYVIGMDKKVDVYDVGFSVRVLMRSDMSLEDKRKFVADNRLDLVKWTISEVVNTQTFKSKIGDMAYYKPVEIVILKVPELEVKFELKKVV